MRMEILSKLLLAAKQWDQRCAEVESDNTTQEVKFRIRPRVCHKSRNQISLLPNDMFYFRLILRNQKG